MKFKVVCLIGAFWFAFMAVVLIGEIAVRECSNRERLSMAMTVFVQGGLVGMLTSVAGIAHQQEQEQQRHSDQ